MPLQQFMHREKPAGLVLGVSIPAEISVVNIAVSPAFLPIFLISGIHAAMAAVLADFVIQADLHAGTCTA